MVPYVKILNIITYKLVSRIAKQISNFQSKYQDIVSAVVQQIQMRCLCNFTETNIQNFEFSCRSIENTVVFRAEISYTSLHQARYREENLVTLVSGWCTKWNFNCCWFNTAWCRSCLSHTTWILSVSLNRSWLEQILQIPTGLAIVGSTTLCPPESFFFPPLSLQLVCHHAG